MELTTRVLNAVGAAGYEMTAILGLLRIEETDAVETAAISCARRPVLRINPEFVRRHCRKDEHLFLLVMHELHHVLLGHTRLFPRVTRAHNIAFDALINSMLVRRFPAEAHTSFFLSFYAGETGPMRLLGPPAADTLADPALRAMHELLYRDDQVTSEEVFNTVADTIGECTNEVGRAVLLGDHGRDLRDAWGTEGPVDPDFVRAIRAIVEKWPPPENPVRGRSLEDALKRADIRPVSPAPRVVAVLRDALLGAATRRTPGRSRESRAVQALVAVPDPSDRRAAVTRHVGVQPLLYAHTSNARRGGSGRARVYLDVSGSMVPYLPHLYGALSSLRAHVEPDVCLFSTDVKEIPLGDVVRGRVSTTGGTDIACVVRHALAHRRRKILVITDGYVGTLGEQDRRNLQGVEVRVVLTPNGWREDLEPVAARITALPQIHGATS